MPILVLVAVIAVISVVDRSLAQPVDIDAAKKEGRVVVYGTIIPQVMGGLHKGFEKKYGIKVDYWRASATKVMDRALTEWRAGKPGYDVVFAIHGSQLIMKQEGLFSKYVPPSAQSFPEKFKDKDGILTTWRVTPVAVLYNTELVKPEEAPKTLDDLLHPKWRNKIGLGDPSQHTSTAEFLWNLNKIKGDRWLEFVMALAKQEPHLMESFAPIPNAIVRGEVHLGITLLQYVVQQKGPLGFALMDKILTDSNDLGLSAKAAKPNAAKLYMEYVCSPEGQRGLADLGEFMVSPGMYPKIKGAEKVIANLVFMDNPTSEQFKELQAQFRQIFFAK